MPDLWERLQLEPVSPMGIAADALIEPPLIGVMLRALGSPLPGICFDLVSGPATGVALWVRERRVHAAPTFVDRQVTGLRMRVAARLRLRLLVPQDAAIDSPGFLWRQGRVAERLICPAKAGAVRETSARGLRALGVHWPVAASVASPSTVRELVASGFGIGLDIERPGTVPYPGVRAIALTGFDSVSLALLWHPFSQERMDRLLAAVKESVGQVWPEAAELARKKSRRGSAG